MIVRMGNISITPPISDGILTFDIADERTDRFICTMKMPVGNIFNITPQDILKYIYTLRPTLKYREIVIELKKTPVSTK